MTIRRCHKEKELVDRIEQSLGVSVRPVQCHIVDEPGMADVMRQAGWARNEADGVIGFQFGANVYVLGTTPWTVLHELLHRSGINADRLNRYVAEGLTEAIAADLKKSPDEHRPTYPEETAWIRQQLLPQLKLTAIELGRRIAASEDPVRMLADLLIAADPALDRTQLIDELKPQRPNAPTIRSSGTAKGSVSRAVRVRPPDLHRCRHVHGSPDRGSDPDTFVEPLSAVLVIAGIVLGLPVVLRKLDGRFS